MKNGIIQSMATDKQKKACYIKSLVFLDFFSLEGVACSLRLNEVPIFAYFVSLGLFTIKINDKN